MGKLNPAALSRAPISMQSYAALAPIAWHSGTWKEKAFIRSGQHYARHGLYMPAPGAIMRWRVILANALRKKDRKCQPRVACP